MNTCHHAVHVRLLKRTLEKISEIKAVRDGGMLLLIVATECSLLFSQCCALIFTNLHCCQFSVQLFVVPSTSWRSRIYMAVIVDKICGSVSNCINLLKLFTSCISLFSLYLPCLKSVWQFESYSSAFSRQIMSLPHYSISVITPLAI